MVVFDLEFSGLDFTFSNTSILSIGAVSFENPEETFYKECRIWEGAEVEDEALKITGFTMEQITDPKKPLPHEITEEFIDWLKKYKDRTLGGQNIYTDYYMFVGELWRSKLKFQPGFRLVELHALAYQKYLQLGKEIPLHEGFSELGLPKILRLCGIDFKGPIPHNALEDAKITAECFSRLINGKSILKEFEDYPVPEYLLR